jgi:hypothetical protein
MGCDVGFSSRNCAASRISSPTLLAYAFTARDQSPTARTPRLIPLGIPRSLTSLNAPFSALASVVKAGMLGIFASAGMLSGLTHDTSGGAVYMLSGWDSKICAPPVVAKMRRRTCWPARQPVVMCGMWICDAHSNASDYETKHEKEGRTRVANRTYHRHLLIHRHENRIQGAVFEHPE